MRTYFFAFLIPLGLLLGERSVEAQESPDLRVVVNMVQLNVAVTDKNGNYITGLRPKDFVIAEDGISERAMNRRVVSASLRTTHPVPRPITLLMAHRRRPSTRL